MESAITVLALGGFTVNRQELRHARPVQVIPLFGVMGPESLAFDADGGGPYTGVSDGRILKWEAEKLMWIDFAASHGHLSNKCRGSQDPQMEHVCGRPLGLKFNTETRELYVADAYLGLLKVGTNDTLATPIATQPQGLPFLFANGLDIMQHNGGIYFTYSSTRFQRREFMSAVISGDKTGKMMVYDPMKEKIQVLLDGLSFPNGLAISHDNSFILVAETSTCRILKYQLRTPSSKCFEVFAELPGFPDNIKRSPSGGYWVALHSKRRRILKWLLSQPGFGELLLRIPFDVQRFGSFISSFSGQAMAIRLGENGEVLEVLEGLGGRKIRFISEVEEHNGILWFGSVLNPFVGLYKLHL